MKNKIFNIKNLLLSTLAATIVFNGCGSDGIDDVYALPGSSITDYQVHVVDDDVKGATLSANECTGFEERGNGNYVLTGCRSRPKAIISTGGYITVTGSDNNESNVSMGFPLMVNTNMVGQSTSYTATPLTTLLATVNDYDELVSLQKQLGFSSVQDMFKDDNTTQDMQRTLNSFFIEASNSGVNLNNFADFTADFRSSLRNAEKGTNALETVKKAKTKMHDDFKKNPTKYTKKYGIVFSGFVTTTDYNSTTGTNDLLANIGNKFSAKKDEIIFSGFIYDDIIGSANPNYQADANITLTNLDTNVTLDLSGNEGNNTKSIIADPYGQYKLSLKENDINESVSYLLEGTITQKNPDTNITKQIKLNSILTGREILSKFKAKLNTADIPDMTISNVTTAKYALLQAKGIDVNDVNAVIEEKKSIETTHKDTLLSVASGIKTIIDGNATIQDANSSDTNNTFDYIKTKISDNGTTFTPADDMEAQIDTYKTDIKNDKTLSTQLKATTDTYKPFSITENAIKDKVLTIKLNGAQYISQLYVFKDYTYIFDKKDENATSTHEIGSWSIVNGQLQLTNKQDASIKNIKLSSLTIGGASYDIYGNFIGANSNPKGSISAGTSTLLFDLTNIANIDYTTTKAPLIKFTSSLVNGKTLIEVYKDNNDKYQDRVFKFSSESVTYNSQTKPYNISDGILNIEDTTTISFSIIQSYDTKIVCTNEKNETVELYYDIVNAKAAEQINNFSSKIGTTNLVQSASWTYEDKNSNNESYNTNTIDDTNHIAVLHAVALNNNLNNYGLSQIGIKFTDTIENTKVVGFKSQIQVTENNGDSERQQAGISARYSLPYYDGNKDKIGQLRVNVFAKSNKIQYKFKLQDSDGNQYDLISPVNIVEENTFNTKYDVMILLIDNVIAIQIKNGENAYYAYASLDTIWKSVSSKLQYYKYPVAFKNSYFWSKLNDDGTGTQFKGKSNAPITAKMSSFKLIDGSYNIDSNGDNIDDTSYTGGKSPYTLTPVSPVQYVSIGGQDATISSNGAISNVNIDVNYPLVLRYKNFTSVINSTNDGVIRLKINGVDMNIQVDLQGVDINTSDLSTATFNHVYVKDNDTQYTYYPSNKNEIFNFDGTDLVINFDAISEASDKLNTYKSTIGNYTISFESYNIMFTGATIAQGSLTINPLVSLSDLAGSWEIYRGTDLNDKLGCAEITSNGVERLYLSSTYGSGVLTNSITLNSDASLNISIPALTGNQTAIIDAVSSAKDELNVTCNLEGTQLIDIFGTSSEKRRLIKTTNCITPFTSSLLTTTALYEVYFDTIDSYGTDANKSIEKFQFNINGTFDAVGLYGNNAGNYVSGTWQIQNGQLSTTTQSINGGTVTTPYTSYSYIENSSSDYFQTHWSDGLDSDKDYYFTSLPNANAFGYATSASENTDTNSTTTAENVSYIKSILSNYLENNISKKINFDNWADIPQNYFDNNISGIVPTFDFVGSVNFEYRQNDNNYTKYSIDTVNFNDSAKTWSHLENKIENGVESNISDNGTFTVSPYNTYTLKKDGNNSDFIKIKFGDELNATVLNSLYSIFPDINFTDGDNGYLVFMQEQQTYINSWDEVVNDWNETDSNITYNTLESFITAHNTSLNRWFMSKDCIDNSCQQGLVFNETNNTLSEVNVDGYVQDAGDYNITGNVLYININIDGYDKNDAFILGSTSGKVEYAEQIHAGDSGANIWFNQSAMGKIQTYFENLKSNLNQDNNTSTTSTFANLLSNKTIYLPGMNIDDNAILVKLVFNENATNVVGTWLRGTGTDFNISVTIMDDTHIVVGDTHEEINATSDYINVLEHHDDNSTFNTRWYFDESKAIQYLKDEYGYVEALSEYTQALLNSMSNMLENNITSGNIEYDTNYVIPVDYYDTNVTNKSLPFSPLYTVEFSYRLNDNNKTGISFGVCSNGIFENNTTIIENGVTTKDNITGTYSLNNGSYSVILDGNSSAFFGFKIGEDLNSTVLNNIFSSKFPSINFTTGDEGVIVYQKNIEKNEGDVEIWYNESAMNKLKIYFENLKSSLNQNDLSTTIASVLSAVYSKSDYDFYVNKITYPALFDTLPSSSPATQRFAWIGTWMDNDHKIVETGMHDVSTGSMIYKEDRYDFAAGTHSVNEMNSTISSDTNGNIVIDDENISVKFVDINMTELNSELVSKGINITMDGNDGAQLVLSKHLADEQCDVGDTCPKAGDVSAEIMYNENLTNKILNVLLADFNTTTTNVFTDSMISGATFYQVYFDTSSDYNTDANKSIAKFLFDVNGTLSAIGLYGNEVNSSVTGTWYISNGILYTNISGKNSQTTIEVSQDGYIRTNWTDGTDSDIDYYFTSLSNANAFGYETNATELNTTVTATASIFQSGDTWKGLVYNTVTSPYTGKVWLDRNLGASEVCTALDDSACYGDYYQWGRNTDGHEKSTSATTSTLSTDINNSGTNFITNGSDPYDWASVDSNGALRSSNWSATDGSSVCPAGYRVPTIDEIKAETTLASTPVTNNTDAFNSFLKLPSAGYRSSYSGSLDDQGSYGNVWSSSPDGSYSQSVYFGSDFADSYYDDRAYGQSVRCLRD